MLNLDDTLIILPSYLDQGDLFSRGVFYAGGIFILILTLRGQIAEVDILQLIPGFYFFLLLVAFIFLLGVSFFISQIPFEIDDNKTWGTKTHVKSQVSIFLKFSLFISSTGIISVLNTLIPVSLDFFNSSGEKTLENTWSFVEVLLLEFLLLFVLAILFQFPVYLIVARYNEKSIQRFPQAWKRLSLLLFFLSGLVTPTVDAYTQSSLTFAAFSLYLIVVTLLLKRIIMKSVNSVHLY
jgi:hypothetical protein